MADLGGRTVFITGGSRGIGLAIGVRAARDGANVVIAAKTDRPHPKLPGTIHTAAEAIEKAGGKALPLVCDIRDTDQIEAAVARAVEAFGGIDVLVNNASAISLTPTPETEPKRYDLMHAVNTRGTFFTTRACLPHLKRSTRAHVLMISPPLNMEARWFSPHVAYTMAKFGMSMCVLGMAEEFKPEDIGVNALWPRTTIATAAVENVVGAELMARSRKPEIMADAAHVMLTRDPAGFTGNFCIDDEVLTGAGVADLTGYAVDPAAELAPDFFI
jgi:citronellol/citronellal dehydrogenase